MTEIKPIETIYNGYRFRSRLEARWAVFFDAAGIKYEYEPEGYEHNGELYLPDFYLPVFDAYVEVKPDRPGMEEDVMKCMRMIHWGGAIQTIIFLGNVPPQSDGGHWHFPTIYYRSGFEDGGHVTSGWWFFQDSYTDDDKVYISGHISGSQYPSPFNIDDQGKLQGRFSYEKTQFGYKHFCLKPSTEAVSDKMLKPKDDSEDPYMDDATLAEFIMNGNMHFYNALAKARQARFEHGECG